MSAQADFQIFCRNIRFLRTSHALTQKQMAEALGISLYCLRKIESGTVPPSADICILFHAQKRFSITPGRLLSEELE